MNLDTEIRLSDAAVQRVIDDRYEAARRVMLDTFNDGRRANGWAPFLILTSQSRVVTAPDRFRCTSCGGRLWVEIEAWESFTGKPEEASPVCQAEVWNAPDDIHRRPDWPAWDSLCWALLRWARSNVRVL